MTIKIEDTLTYKALASVLGHCDGARSDDGSGFSAYDADFARDIITKGPTYGWSEKQGLSAKRLAHKYRKQIAGNGFDCAAITDEALPVVRQRERAEQPNVVLHFDRVHKALGRATIYGRGKETVCVPNSLIKGTGYTDAGVYVEVAGWFVAKEFLTDFANPIAAERSVLSDALGRCEPHITF